MTAPRSAPPRHECRRPRAWSRVAPTWGPERCIPRASSLPVTLPCNITQLLGGLGARRADGRVAEVQITARDPPERHGKGGARPAPGDPAGADSTGPAGRAQEW